MFTSIASHFRTIFSTQAVATQASTSQHHEVDLEAQTITISVTPIALPTPPPALSHSPRQEEAGTSDPIDDFFGVTRSRGTSDSRHDSFATTPLNESDIPPPPYADSSDLPSYSSVAEPPTLAMYLFKFGFLFPLFWLAGIIILISPLQAPENWEPSKSEQERQELIELLRKTERKWAKRCYVAFLVFFMSALAIACTAVLVMRSSS